MKRAVLALILAAAVQWSAPAQTPVPSGQGTAAPQAEISNGRIHARLYLPDAQAGYYRGTRFDWSGVIPSLEWKGHTYFGQWFERYDPKLHDAITGPVEEFLTNGSGLGYDEARAGENFVRIGVGAVRKPDEPAYRRFGTYDIVDPGKWGTRQGAGWIEFVHELRDTAGYGYVYTKRVRLDRDSLVLEHRLKNTGRKTIATSVYNHDFFMLDNQPTGPDFVVRFPFAPRATADLNGLGEIRGNDFVYLKEFGPRQTLYTEIEGFGATARDFDFRVENRKTGAGVRETSDRPISKIAFWSHAKTVCPEAYIDLQIAPGKESSWRIAYEFYQAKRE
jgi:hypothetical protein